MPKCHNFYFHKNQRVMKFLINKTVKIFFGKFNPFLRHRPICEAKWNLIKTFKF